MNRRHFTKLVLLAPAIAAAPRRAVGVTLGDGRPLCLQYLGRVQDMLLRIRENHAEDLLEVAYHIAATAKNGGHNFNSWDMGHNTAADLFPNRHGDPGLFTGYNASQAQAGDTLLLSIISRPMEDPREKGVFVVGAPAPWAAETPDASLLRPEHRQLKYREYCDIWIDTGISTWGAIMELPGESVPFGAVSGVLGQTTFWMMVADAVRILARDGFPVTVAGDEPEITDEGVRPFTVQAAYNRYVNLDKPLGTIYFDTAMAQLSAIEAELGSINHVADMIADAVLSGGHVYYYSRYDQTLAHESRQRRGGLLMNRSVADEDGELTVYPVPYLDGEPPLITDKDVVVMGIYQPEDPVDLKHLRELRRIGAKVCSIGPASRDGIIPSGDTVPGQTDIHLGNMCDTYGLFSIPGVSRKVCPTSGLLVNQLYYALQMQVAEKIIQRTGNTPRVDMNAAMLGDPEKRQRDYEIIRTRGY